MKLTSSSSSSICKLEKNIGALQRDISKGSRFAEVQCYTKTQTLNWWNPSLLSPSLTHNSAKENRQNRGPIRMSWAQRGSTGEKNRSWKHEDIMCFLFQAIFARCHQTPISTLEVAEMCWLRRRHTVFVDLRYMVSRHWWLMNGPTKTACSSLIICSDLGSPNSDSWCWISCEIIGKLLHVHILYYIFLPHHLDIRCFTAKSTQNEISSCLFGFFFANKRHPKQEPKFSIPFFPQTSRWSCRKLRKKNNWVSCKSCKTPTVSKGIIWFAREQRG